MPPTLLLACDLDRTVLPNGPESLSPGAVAAFEHFVKQPFVHLAYVSGRDLGLIQTALTDYHIPLPHTAIGDVGTTVYQRNDHTFTIDSGWSTLIAPDWHGHTGPEIHLWLNQVAGLRLQEPSKQNTFKLSYYTPETIDEHTLVDHIQSILRDHQIQAAVIWSIDQIAHTGLLDILPSSATKLHAIEYLRAKLGLEKNQVVYAGDSGNDLEPLTGGYHAIVVHNALPSLVADVKALALAKGVAEHVYYAHGEYQRMNGNYVAGILEGLHYFEYV